MIRSLLFILSFSSFIAHAQDLNELSKSISEKKSTASKDGTNKKPKIIHFVLNI